MQARAALLAMLTFLHLPLPVAADAGRITANEPATPNDPFDGKTLVMHVRGCAPGELRIPFHVGEDHSRTWVLTRTASGLRLKHDHRHADGTADVLTLYGGDTVAPSSARRQEFPVDAESRELFRVEFDLTRPIPNPPPPWGDDKSP